MKTVSVTLEFGTEIPDDTDLNTSDGYDKALELAAADVSTRGESEIRDAIIDVVSED